MKGQLSIEQIALELGRATKDLQQYCSSLQDKLFFYQPEGKWSAAQQVKHLIKATDTSSLAFTLPKFLVRMVGGRPNRDSGTYEELVAKYQLKLQQGGKASSRYIPKPISASYGKEKLLTMFGRSMKRMISALQRNWKEPRPDQFIVPHPLLGKITLRELCYFTIHHTYHHLHSIRNLNCKE